MKALRIIIGVSLLLVSLIGGLKLLVSEFNLIIEFPSAVFRKDVFFPLFVFLAAAALAAFLTPRCFQFYILLICAFNSLSQIGCLHWIPLVVAVAALLPLAVMRSKWLRRALIILSGSLALLVVDAYAFHHRIAVFANSLHSIVAFDHDPEILRSPSGQTTAYLVSGGFLDPEYVICISSNRLLPTSKRIDLGIHSTSTDIIARWNGPIFFAGDKIVAWAYDERSGQFIDHETYCRGGVRISDEAFMKHIKTPEAFAEYLLSLPPKN